MDMWLHSSKRASLFSVKWRITFDTPQTMPCVNQLVMMCLEAPDANSRSPSVEVIERDTMRSLRRARISAQIMAIGVRDMVHPPMATCSPSCTSFAASSSDITFSRRPRSRASVAARSCRYGLTRLSLLMRGSSSSLASRRCRHAAVAIEGFNHLVPLRHQVLQATPELPGAAAVKIGERDALLLHPSEVAEIKHALALTLAGVEHVLGAGADQMLADDLRRDLRDQLCAVVAPPQVAGQFARVHRMAVGRHRDDHIGRTKSAVLGHLDGAQYVGDRGKAEVGQGGRNRLRHAEPPRKIIAAHIGVEDRV